MSRRLEPRGYADLQRSINIEGNEMNNERSTTRGKGRDTSTSALQLTKKLIDDIV